MPFAVSASRIQDLLGRPSSFEREWPVRTWTDPRDGKIWQVDVSLADPYSSSVWKVTAPSAHGVIVRFCRPDRPDTSREVYYAAPTSPCEASQIPEEHLICLLDRAKGPSEEGDR
jgi:hypothetical protein